ncbi:nucleotidyltransferase domain-containing protein [Aphanothece sacrum]|uniref:DNA polymerase beta domain-containing protein region n=1 Tax=Aphanothece sacrum FPU1 TaxID=1920663 RepID=A0A401IIH0_APHSA|nr:nucleotidyltransferase domain-containing protein [Aphanothece sacrum]GBF80970.1 DNA polymerase beta domain-containing protein region [Aphanothece sacrum FPU1]GBF85277.1 DNA polymerase beta domain-containing protein [Aphanothece sacrum FPU3]
MPKLLNTKLTTILDELKQSLRNIYGEQLFQLILYGSQARGEAQPDSDIDILIVLNKSFDYSQEIERTSHLIADLSLKYNTLISRSFIDSLRLTSENSSFIRNINNEGILL